ncbi:MAG: sugar phosphate nucleotidyltransferase [bacterium]
MKGLILAAGIGKRARPLTNSLPKSLIPVAGRPMIEYSLRGFQKAKIDQVAIVVSPKDYRTISERLGDGHQWNMNFTYIEQERPLGTADAVARAQEFVARDNFLLAYCDHVSFYDFRGLIESHLNFHPLATLLINKEENPETTGQVVWEGNLVKRIVEKPKDKISDYGISGLLIIEPDIFQAIPHIQLSAEGEYHIGDALQYLINRKFEVRYRKIDTWRINVNSLEDIKRAEALILKNRSQKEL